MTGTDTNFDTSWNVEKYYNPHEPPTHWELKKKFMQTNKYKFPERRLVCLASTFLNVEVMGCSYNPQTMKLLQELSKGVVEEYHEKKKLRIQKVFVKASDAAASRIRGGKTDAKTSFRAPITTTSQAKEGLERAFVGATDGMLAVRIDTVQQPRFSVNPEDKFQPESKHGQGMKKSKRKRDNEGYVGDIPKECRTCYGNLVLIEDEGTNISPRQIIERSASLCQAKISIKEQQLASNEMLVNISIGGIQLVSAKDASAKKAREMAYQSALQKLQEVCYTVKIKVKQYYDEPVGKDLGFFDPEEKKEDENTSVVDSVEMQKEDAFVTGGGNSKALKMMANMGWTGGGLGKSQQGITEPISLQVKANRSGIGSKAKNKNREEEDMKPETVFRKKAAALLETYASSDSEKDLVFTTDFTNEERKILHQLCPKYDLKSRSYGKQAGRHLVISRKLEPFAVVRTLLTPGYKSEKYELLKPVGAQNIV